MVNLLLAKGANINAFDKKDSRALHWAAYTGETASRIDRYYLYMNNTAVMKYSDCAPGSNDPIVIQVGRKDVALFCPLQVT